MMRILPCEDAVLFDVVFDTISVCVEVNWTLKIRDGILSLENSHQAENNMTSLANWMPKQIDQYFYRQWTMRTRFFPYKLFFDQNRHGHV